MKNETIHSHFLDNHQTADHHSIVYGIRELTDEESTRHCLNRTQPTFTESVRFTSNYSLRMYQSACLYLDSNHQWQSKGLLVRMTEYFLFHIESSHVGRTKDQSLSNTMFFHSSHNICYYSFVCIIFHRLPSRNNRSHVFDENGFQF